MAESKWIRQSFDYITLVKHSIIQQYTTQHHTTHLVTSQNSYTMSSTTAVPRFGSKATKPDSKPLGEPLVFPFSKRSAQNRFLNVAMSERMASFDAKDVGSRGIPSEKLVKLYERWGEGTWGQILTGNVMIHPEHLEAPGNMVIPSDAEFHGLRFDRFAALATASKRHGSLIVAQVSHPGRQTNDTIQTHPISASAIPLVAPQMGVSL